MSQQIQALNVRSKADKQPAYGVKNKIVWINKTGIKILSKTCEEQSDSREVSSNFGCLTRGVCRNFCRSYSLGDHSRAKKSTLTVSYIRRHKNCAFVCFVVSILDFQIPGTPSQNHKNAPLIHEIDITTTRRSFWCYFHYLATSQSCSKTEKKLLIGIDATFY